ncbi:AT-hook motif nuclear-localized protein 1-like [Nymphaea colorata]|nr:AT-hook motif nuclear-localized protein 1-like [Nymphaea colorata]
MEGREGASSGAPDPAASYGTAAVATGGGGVYNAVAAAAAARSESPPVVDGGGGVPSGMMSFATSFGKKRGRPRRYDRDDGMALALTPISASSPGPFSSKRSRGRPPGSGNKQRLAALGEWIASSAGGGFTPHVITIAAGEDITMKIMSFSQKGPRAICVLSANGAISNVTLRQPDSSGGTLTYEGRFEILSLSGSFMLTETGGHRSRTGGLSVSLASPDGRVVGGGVAGLLMAASPVQIVVGSFMPNHQEPQIKKSKFDAPDALPQMFSSTAATAAIPISCSGMDGSYEEKNQPVSSNHQHKPVASYQNDGWTPTNPVPESRDSINDSLPKDSQLSH